MNYSSRRLLWAVPNSRKWERPNKLRCRGAARSRTHVRSFDVAEWGEGQRLLLQARACPSRCVRGHCNCSLSPCADDCLLCRQRDGETDSSLPHLVGMSCPPPLS